ncbi:MAG TPA: GDSL-type esterase/lipase family protein [Acetobacteraceae bacterium]|nr:GDSL-type esterase/lipase family protein [Acetobacteraceae bacterium]
MPRLLLLVTGLGALLARPAWPEDAPTRPLLVAVYGDSQAEGLAAALRHATHGDPFRILNRTKPGTALGQPSTYDWVAEVQNSLATDHPAIAVMMFGGNDRVPTRLPDGRALPFRSDAWLALYRTRLQQLIAALTQTHTLIVWCGDPDTRDPRYANDMAYLNDLYRAALPAAAASYVDIWNVAAGPGGSYESHGPGIDGVVQRLRTDDGIHFTAAGYALVAQRVLQAMAHISEQNTAQRQPPPASATTRAATAATTVPPGPHAATAATTVPPGPHAAPAATTASLSPHVAPSAVTASTGPHEGLATATEPPRAAPAATTAPPDPHEAPAATTAPPGPHQGI